MKKIFLLIMFFSPLVIAKTTWIPISNGSNFIIIPFIPSYTYPSPGNIYISGSLIVWDEVEHASNYLVQGKNLNGEWENIALTEYTFINFDNQFFGYSEIRVQACNINTCSDTGAYSNFIIEGKKKYPAKAFNYDALGRLIRVSNSNGKDTEYEYDPAGNRKAVVEKESEK